MGASPEFYHVVLLFFVVIAMLVAGCCFGCFGAAFNTYQWRKRYDSHFVVTVYIIGAFFAVWVTYLNAFWVAGWLIWAWRNDRLPWSHGQGKEKSTGWIVATVLLFALFGLVFLASIMMFTSPTYKRWTACSPQICPPELLYSVKEAAENYDDALSTLERRKSSRAFGCISPQDCEKNPYNTAKDRICYRDLLKTVDVSPPFGNGTFDVNVCNKGADCVDLRFEYIENTVRFDYSDFYDLNVSKPFMWMGLMDCALLNNEMVVKSNFTAYPEGTTFEMIKQEEDDDGLALSVFEPVLPLGPGCPVFALTYEGAQKDAVEQKTAIEGKFSVRPIGLGVDTAGSTSALIKRPKNGECIVGIIHSSDPMLAWTLTLCATIIVAGCFAFSYLLRMQEELLKGYRTKNGFGELEEQKETEKGEESEND